MNVHEVESGYDKLERQSCPKMITSGIRRSRAIALSLIQALQGPK